MDGIGFLEFQSGLYPQLVDIATQQQVTEPQLKGAILDLTKFINQLLKIPESSKLYRINIIEYDTFEELYGSLNQELIKHKTPFFLIAGFLNLKDADVPGYVAFSLPTSFMEKPNGTFTLTELLINAAHERVGRYLLKETIVAKVYEKAREDYHGNYTLDKKKNIEAFFLYKLNEELIPLQETVTYAVNQLVDDFLNTKYAIFNEIQLPLIDREFDDTKKGVSQEFIATQLSRAQLDRVEPEQALKRITTGLEILQLVTNRFQTLITDFIDLYPQIKATLNPEDEVYDLSRGIDLTINRVLKENGLNDLMALFDEQLKNS